MRLIADGASRKFTDPGSGGKYALDAGDDGASKPSVPVAFLRRAFAWWFAQMKRALPPTIFFFVGFNLILWTKVLILEEHGIKFSGLLTATVAALLVGKAVLVTDHMPFMRRLDGAPLIQPILFKSGIYWLCVLVVRLGERLVHFLTAGGAIADFPHHLVEHFSWARFLSISDLANGAYSLSTSRYMN